MRFIRTHAFMDIVVYEKQLYRGKFFKIRADEKAVTVNYELSFAQCKFPSPGGDGPTSRGGALLIEVLALLYLIQ